MFELIAAVGRARLRREVSPVTTYRRSRMDKRRAGFAKTLLVLGFAPCWERVLDSVPCDYARLRLLTTGTAWTDSGA